MLVHGIHEKHFSEARKTFEDISFGEWIIVFENLPNLRFQPAISRIYRTAEFMRWKYDLNPDVAYNWLSVWSNNGLLGYFVFTQTQGRLRKVVNVYDWEQIDYVDAFEPW